MKKIIIFGGGLAGISAAVLLSERGYKIELYESKNHLGGRAFSFMERTTGEIIDNGQHILMGCYKYSLDFLNLIKSKNKLYIPEKLDIEYKDSDLNNYFLKIPNLPAPFHILKSLFTTDMIPKKELLSVFRLAIDIYRINSGLYSPVISIKELFEKNNLGENTIKRIWKPIIVSALNGDPEKIDSVLFAKTIYQMFFRKYDYTRFIIPGEGLSDLFLDGSLKIMEKNNVKIKINTAIKSVVTERNIIIHLVTSENEKIEADYYISAINFNDLKKFPDLAESAGIKEIDNMTGSPIISIYLWLDHELFSGDFIFILNANIQVIFNRSKITKKKSGYFLYCIVISSANHLINCSKEYILSVIKTELEKIFKKTVSVKYFKIVKERTATLLITPGLNRPNTKTELSNFFVIGDWINTHLPATIESAIYSGYKINELI
jgi:hydroxysqualene dehydroxylase